MDFVSLTNIGASSLSASGILGSPLVHHLIGHEIMHSFFSMIRGKKGKKLTRAQRRKLMNSRRRWFTDNVIMHHKRIHDKNRQIVVSSAKDRAMSKKLGRGTKMAPSNSTRWRDRVDIHDRGLTIRGRIDARRLRARSRWLSVVEASR
jgi:hypothetical protein